MKGKPHLWFSLFLFALQTEIYPFGRYERWGISLVATSDQRFTALDPCRLLKKAGENF